LLNITEKMKQKNQNTNRLPRRSFFKRTALGGAGLLLVPSIQGSARYDYKNTQYLKVKRATKALAKSAWYLDLSPAQWIWYPAQRILSNTFFLFRRVLEITKPIKKATGWILGESRYLCFCNGQRVQFGPAPADPRYTEADPIDLTPHLKQGKNVLGAQVMYYGYGDGTWPAGKYGFIFHLKIEYEDGTQERLVSDDEWKVFYARCWKPGQYKRWYLRALQEEFDARLYPFNWYTTDFKENEEWLQAAITGVVADKPALATNAPDYQFNSGGYPELMELRKRMLPMPKEHNVAVVKLMEVQAVNWKTSPQTYFELLAEDAFEVGTDVPVVTEKDSGKWEVRHQKKDEGILLTFELEEQVVGWPYVRLNVPEGTVVELMVQEGHKAFKAGGDLVMNNHFNAWSRITCQAGSNYFEPFDYESLRFIQLHIYQHQGEKMEIEQIGVRRRLYPWKVTPNIKVADAKVQQVLDACINTVYNNSIETMVDGMGRERQQYSGDLGHQVHAIHSVFGAPEFYRRYLVTYSQGMTKDGFFLDTWPAYDRLNRLAQRQLDLTPWGPLLDHGIGFNFDCYYHYLYSGHFADLEEVFPRLLRFFHYLQDLVATDGLLPVEDIGVPAVWMDTDAYKKQRHKQCAFNLYTVGMLREAFVPLCQAAGEKTYIEAAEELASLLHKNTIARYWDNQKQYFINNLPWLKEEQPLMDDRSLAMACLFELAPNNNYKEMEKVLAEVPANLGRSYPPNTNWWLWALAKSKNAALIVKDFTVRWFNLKSVQQNNTMQEAWHVEPDSGSQWSHGAIAPLYVTFMNLAGIMPTLPGFETYQVFPQLGGLDTLELTYHTIKGNIEFKVEGRQGKKSLTLKTLAEANGLLVLSEKERVKLEIAEDAENGFVKYILPKGKEVRLKLQHT